MKANRRITPGSIFPWLVIPALLIVIAVVVRRTPPPNPAGQPSAAVTGNPNGLSAAASSTGAATTPLRGSPAATNSPGFQLRPLAVANETAAHQWTAEDARDTNVIRQLAHNDAEYQRMVEENPRIHRRQLVYRNDTAAAVLQRARLSGEPVAQLTLPGFDGQELQVIIERADLEPSKQSGTFTGRLAHRPNSLVTLAFKFGREAFTVLSPDDGTYLQAHPREPGELILTSFDPDTYQPVPGGEPIRTAQQ